LVGVWVVKRGGLGGETGGSTRGPEGSVGVPENGASDGKVCPVRECGRLREAPRALCTFKPSGAVSG
jgi:hypothetical protein